jgi:uncharacterized protein (TIGR02646 family)
MSIRRKQPDLRYMRRLFRPALDSVLEDYLDRMQALVNSGADTTSTWKAQRQSVHMQRIVQVLTGMTGLRQRCMYCEDSRGTDVEHFKPKIPFRDYAFRWLNFLWICTGCNRGKGNRFPCDESGSPLLLDPTLDEPWDFLFFDPDTGEIAARWEVGTGAENPRGKVLLEILAPLRHQAVTEGRRRISMRLRRAVRSFLAHHTGEAEKLTAATIEDLLDDVDDAMDYGIAFWFFLRDGRNDEPFGQLRTRFPLIWKTILDRLIPG